MTPFPARVAALHVLETIDRPDAPALQSVLDSKLRTARLSPLDKALCTELVYGVTRHHLLLNWIAGQFLRNPGKTPEALRRILAIASYELLFLERIPPHASVNTAVDLVRAVLGGKCSGVANGVLRSLVREDVSRFLPEAVEQRLGTTPQGLSIAWSLPEWIIRLWIDAYGKEKTLSLVRAASRTPRACLRFNARFKDATQQRDALLSAIPGAHPLGNFGLLLPPGSHLAAIDELLQSGRASRQGAGSQRVLDALDAFSLQGPVWDACAGFGGKTCALLERGVAVAVASDTSVSRLRGLRRELERLNLPRPLIVSASATTPPFCKDFHPASILIDAPCSGLGTLSKRPDLRLHRTADHLPPLVSLQSQILDAAWKRLKPEGTLVYITCTLNPQENEQQIDRMLNAHTDASAICRFESTPGDDGADLMFGAVLRKTC